MQIPNIFRRNRPLDPSGAAAGEARPATLSARPAAPGPGPGASAATAGNAELPPGEAAPRIRLNRFGEAMPMLGAESPLAPTSPRSLAEEPARHRAFSGLSDTFPEPVPTSPRAPLRSVHPAGGSLAREAATTIPRAETAGRTALTAASMVAGGLNGGALAGVFSALPPVEPVSIALSAAASAVDAGAALRANRRGKDLRAVREHASDYACDHPGAGHDRVADEVLPYAIGQMDKRKARKGRAAIPFVGAIGEGIRGIWTHFRKRRAGTLGVERHAQSDALAEHLTTGNCGLAEAATGALFGSRRTEALRGMAPEDASRAIAARLKPN